MTFVRIAPGSFLMGSPDSDELAFDSERPQHEVSITKPSDFGATQVTVGHFRRFVEAEEYRTDAEKDGEGGYGWNESAGKFEQAPEFTWRNPGFAQEDDQPVVNVSWNDAVAFCAWLSMYDTGSIYFLRALLRRNHAEVMMGGGPEGHRHACRRPLDDRPTRRAG